MDEISFIIETVQCSSQFEKMRRDLKKQYLLSNINEINNIMKEIPNCRGSFGTWYPFYALWNNFEGNLPIIQEQLRYNQKLLDLLEKQKDQLWKCFACMRENNLPNLKTVCNCCSNIEKWLKPRKIINRLPDIDMWAIIDDDKIEENKKILKEICEEHGLYPSDIDPKKTMKEFQEIISNLKQQKLPQRFLPLDMHIIGHDTLNTLIKQVPEIIQNKMDIERESDDLFPYLPILPLSLRKIRQYDDEPYNFILDFLFSFTPLFLSDELNDSIIKARKEVAKLLDTTKKRLSVLKSVCNPSIKRRLETPELKNFYLTRIKSWEE